MAVDDNDPARNLECRQALQGQFADLCRGCREIRAQHHGGGKILAQGGMGYGKGHRLGYGRVLQQDLVNLPRRDLFTAAIDDFLDPARKEKVPFLVKIPFIAGAEPALDECGPVCCRIVLVAPHDVRTANDDFAFLARGKRFPCWSITATSGPAGSPTEPGLRAAGGRGLLHIWCAGLRHAISLDGRHAERLLEASHHRRRQR